MKDFLAPTPSVRQPLFETSEIKAPKFEISEPEKMQFHTPSRSIPPLDSPPHKWSPQTVPISGSHPSTPWTWLESGTDPSDIDCVHHLTTLRSSQAQPLRWCDDEGHHHARLYHSVEYYYITSPARLWGSRSKQMSNGHGVASASSGAQSGAPGRICEPGHQQHSGPEKPGQSPHVVLQGNRAPLTNTIAPIIITLHHVICQN